MEWEKEFNKRFHGFNALFYVDAENQIDCNATNEVRDFIKQSITELLEDMPTGKTGYEAVAGGGEYSAGYNDALDYIKRWRDKVINNK